MNLERFNEYVNKYKAIPVSDELKEKTISRAEREYRSKTTENPFS